MPAVSPGVQGYFVALSLVRVLWVRDLAGDWTAGLIWILAYDLIYLLVWHVCPKYNPAPGLFLVWTQA